MSDKHAEAVQLAFELGGTHGGHYFFDHEELLQVLDKALAQQPAQAVPEGWKLVPVEPTDDMLVFGQEVWAAGRQGALEDCREAETIYSAMLAAAPAAPAAPVAQEPVALEQRATEAYALLRRVYDSGFDDDCVDAVGDWLNEHHTSPAAEQPDSVVVPRELFGLADKWLLDVTHSEQVPNEVSQQAAAAHFYVRALLAGGDKP